MPFDKLTVDPNQLKKTAKNLGKLLPNPITDAAKSYVEADVNVAPGSVSYSLLEQEGNFARVNVAASEGGGYALILKKVYEIWVVIAAGQDKPGKDVGQKYGLPQTWYSTDY